MCIYQNDKYVMSRIQNLLPTKSQTKLDINICWENMMCFYNKSYQFLLFTLIILLYLKGITGHNGANSIYYYFHKRE